MASICTNSDHLADLEERAEEALEEENPEEALKLANQIIELVDDSPVYFALRGRALFGLCRPKEALADFIKAADLEPETLDYHISVAGCLVFLDKPEEALKVLETAFRLCGGQDNQEALSIQAEAHLGCGHWWSAIESATAALEIEEDAYTLYIRALAFAKVGGYLKEALDDIHSAIERDDDCAAFYLAKDIILDLIDEVRKSIEEVKGKTKH